jgi:glucoamylase
MNSTEISDENYIKIGNHGAIFNNRTAALIGLDGTMDWACFPNFDSDPIFDSILDYKKGGYFMFKPLCDTKLNQYYEEFTNILITEFIKNNDVILRLTDFLPISEFSTVNFPEIHRFVEVLDNVKVKIHFKPNFNFGTEIPEIEENDNGYLFRGSKSNVGLSSNFKLNKGNMLVYNDDITLGKGTYQWLVISAGINHISKVYEYKSYARLEETRNYWRVWSNKIDYHGLYHKYLMRSALTLKGLFYDPTGMMVAAPTSSLPEAIGGERNWDYRFTWARDTAYVIDALSMVGLKDEATKFLYDMMNKINADKRLRTIYPINGSGSITEKIIDYSGYRNSAPVRIGNKAEEQLQIDQYGSIVNAIYHFALSGGMVTVQLWDFILDILNSLKLIWKYSDSSIWEFRTEPKQYVYSKLLSWTAFHRAGIIGRKLGYSGNYDEWKSIEDEIKNEILEQGFNKDLNSFVQYYGSDTVDASMLIMPLTDFLDPDDYRLVGTIKMIESRLMNSSYLFKRYIEDDGIKGKDNAFLLLSFWYIEDLIKMDRVSDAKEVLESILKRSNHLMLFSEEIDFDSYEMLGNFPQAITHLGVISAITKLNNEFKRNEKSSILK